MDCSLNSCAHIAAHSPSCHRPAMHVSWPPSEMWPRVCPLPLLRAPAMRGQRLRVLTRMTYQSCGWQDVWTSWLVREEAPRTSRSSSEECSLGRSMAQLAMPSGVGQVASGAREAGRECAANLILVMHLSSGNELAL